MKTVSGERSVYITDKAISPRADVTSYQKPFSVDKYQPTLVVCCVVIATI